ncbi:flagellar hook-length control protein FliK [Thalassospira marina]|uniref:Flagellar hook-length control protein-like C-terminal domain-containing protein n=1 Tax=Thalassospira marina TaxID=2048283 RepID=A0A2N3KZF8_9PROT|nr:flagellar hook-length control protein FliK [Thalassospira marina]PKR55918.1 hypothetical protein COO20_01485 [Thalassospira marina]
MHSSAIDKISTPTISVPAQNQPASSSVAFADIMDKVHAERAENAARTQNRPANNAAEDTALRDSRSNRDDRSPVNTAARDDRDASARNDRRDDEPVRKADDSRKDDIGHKDKPKSAERPDDKKDAVADDKPAQETADKDTGNPKDTQGAGDDEKLADTSKPANAGTTPDQAEATGDQTVAEAIAAATQPVIASQTVIGIPTGMGAQAENMQGGDGSSKDALLNSTALSQSGTANGAVQGDGSAAKTMQATAMAGMEADATADGTGNDAKTGFEAALKQQGAAKPDANANTGNNSQNGNNNTANAANANNQAGSTNVANLAALQSAATPQGATPAASTSQTTANAGVGAIDGASANSAVTGLPGQNVTGTTTATVTAQAATAQAGKGAATAETVQQQVAVHIKNAASDGVDRISVQLRPEHLGRVDVKLEIHHDGHVQTVVQADNRQTLDMLRQDVKGLQQALRDAGLSADSQSFTFEHRQEGGQGQNQNQQAGNSGRNGTSRPNEGDIISGAELAQHVAVGYGINSNGLVDIRI